MIKNSVSEHYNASAANYGAQYERSLLGDISRDYPANYFRLHLLLNSFMDKGVKRVIEVGVGEGTPLATLAKAGMDVFGFDLSEKMVQASQNTFKKNGLNPENIIWGDIQDPITYAELLRNGQYDALLAMGVMPHVQNDETCLINMKALIKSGGSVFVEFRNKLFSLFTFNRYTYEFIMDDLLSGVSSKLKDIVGADLKSRLNMNKPSPRNVHNEDPEAPGYDAILSKFHNPFEVTRLFEKCGFKDIKLLWYHYHPAMPYLASEDEKLFRSEALKLEHDSLGWRGLFLCSAFVVEAVKA